MMQMKSRNRLIIGGIIAIVVLAAVSFPLWRPFFVNDVVDEAFPMLTDSEREALRNMPQDQRDVLMNMSSDNPDMAAETVRAMMEGGQTMDEAMPAGEPVVLARGTFSYMDAVHNGEGTATIYELPDGQRVVRFENFRVTNGPDLHVLLSPEVPDAIFADIGDAVELGALKGNVGSQNYEIPAEVNLDDYASVIIFCQPFRVVFSTAALTRSE